MRPQFNSKGFTLVEVMTVVAIIGIMSTIAIHYISKSPYKQRAATRDFYSNVQKVRMEAIRIRSDISFGINDNSNVIDVYDDKGFRKSIALPYGSTISSKDVPSGALDTHELPKLWPSYLYDKCDALGYGPSLASYKSCPEVIKYFDYHDGTKYDHVTTWSSLGYVKVGSGNYQIKLQNTSQNVEIGVAGSMNIGEMK